MGFGREARRVRDSSLPHGHRLHALGSCIEMSGPIGFNATWSYLEARIGESRRSIEFLTPAIDLLETQRRAGQDLEVRYAALRRSQKRAGLRSPRRDEVTPRSPSRWHGDERTGAIHELTVWLDRRLAGELVEHPQGAAAVDAARLAAATTTPDLDPESLQHTLDWARDEVYVIGWTPDRTDYRLAWVTLFLLGQVHLVLHGQPAIGSSWNFVPPPGAKTARKSAVHPVLRNPIGLWRSSPLEGTAELIDAATDLLVLGYDGPALRQLAGMSARDSQFEVEPVVMATLLQLGASDLVRGTSERAGLEARLERFLDGELDLRALSRWAHSVIGHEGDDELQPFVLLDDIYDDWENAGLDLVYLEQVTRRASNAFLAGQPVTQLDYLEPPPIQGTNRGSAPSQRRWRDRLKARRSPT